MNERTKVYYPPEERTGAEAALGGGRLPSGVSTAPAMQQPQEAGSDGNTTATPSRIPDAVLRGSSGHFLDAAALAANSGERGPTSCVSQSSPTTNSGLH